MADSGSKAEQMSNTVVERLVYAAPRRAFSNRMASTHIPVLIKYRIGKEAPQYTYHKGRAVPHPCLGSGD